MALFQVWATYGTAGSIDSTSDTPAQLLTPLFFFLVCGGSFDDAGACVLLTY